MASAAIQLVTRCNESAAAPTIRAVSWSLVLLASCGVGCGRGDYPLASVTGRVTDRGQPVANVSVVFQPIGGEKENPGPASFGITDADGHYALRTYNDDRVGAVVGKHRVFVSTTPREDQPDGVRSVPGKPVPARFQDGSTMVEVPNDGLSASDFDLAQSPG